MVAHERRTEPRVTIEWLLAKPRSFSNLRAFLDLNGTILRMMNQSWTRVPSVLSTVASTMSTQSDKESILKFKETLETQSKLGSLQSTFDAMISTVDKNIKLRLTDLFHWSIFRYNIIYRILYTEYHMQDTDYFFQKFIRLIVERWKWRKHC